MAITSKRAYPPSAFSRWRDVALNWAFVTPSIGFFDDKALG
jgi:hypothetical protein